MEQERLELGEVPADGADRVLAQLPLGADPLEAVDHDEALMVRRIDHHGDGDELSDLGDRGDERPLSGGRAGAELAVPLVKLLKLELHGAAWTTRGGQPAIRSNRAVLAGASPPDRATSPPQLPQAHAAQGQAALP